MPQKIITRSLLNSLGVVIYVIAIAALMNNGSRLFGEKDTFLMGAGFLLIFCVSAATVGGLVFGYPIMLFLNGQKREAVNAAAITVGFLAIEATLLLTGVALVE